jgi:hypothetical protein
MTEKKIRTAMEIYTQIILEDYQEKIKSLTNEIATEQELLENLKSTMNGYSLETPIDLPDAINDVDDRKKIIIFFNDQIGLWGMRTYAPGLFTNKTNIPFLCIQEKLECPQWYLDKYFPTLKWADFFNQSSM